jgi:hypothetical protein
MLHKTEKSQYSEDPQGLSGFRGRKGRVKRGIWGVREARWIMCG